ncbi:ABC transporter substrate-binding protein [uncultured Friedmanniella sp.]|uniref:ABC transporter substrate-binding protein n=1 Tax=uncultured Friedmanniella sp. TaxID=335381 RepID=UPI0035CB2D11
MSITTRTRAGSVAARAALLIPVLALALAACSTSDAATTSAPSADANGNTAVVVADNTTTATRTEITVQTQAALRDELPAAVRDRGTLVIGVGALPAGFPPLAYVGDDHKTLTGAEPDLGRLVAATLGLKPDLQNNAWENMFVRLSSGQLDVGFSNITVTEERKQKYDFASYRDDNLAFAVTKDDPWTFDGDYHALAGKTVAVGSGTNQEKILLEWQKKLKAEGQTLEVRYYKDNNSTYLALASGRIDAYFGPNPGIAYQDQQSAATSTPTRTAGTYSGAGDTLQGLIAATTKKDSGLAKPVADAINYLITSGQYDAWLKAYNLQNEAVKSSEINPPGLPLDNA